MQRICKACKKPVSIMSNFCSTTCFTDFSEKRLAYFRKLIKAQPEHGKHLTTQEIEELKIQTKTLFNPMENEYQ